MPLLTTLDIERTAAWIYATGDINSLGVVRRKAIAKLESLGEQADGSALPKAPPTVLAAAAEGTVSVRKIYDWIDSVNNDPDLSGKSAERRAEIQAMHNQSIVNLKNILATVTERLGLQ